eukprot:Gb_34373 [translate_table: standard]
MIGKEIELRPENGISEWISSGPGNRSQSPSGNARSDFWGVFPAVTEYEAEFGQSLFVQGVLENQSPVAISWPAPTIPLSTYVASEPFTSILGKVSSPIYEWSSECEFFEVNPDFVEKKNRNPRCETPGKWVEYYMDGVALSATHLNGLEGIPCCYEYEEEFGFFPPVKLIEGSLPFLRPYSRMILDRIESTHFSLMNEGSDESSYKKGGKGVHIRRRRTRCRAFCIRFHILHPSPRTPFLGERSKIDPDESAVGPGARIYAAFADHPCTTNHPKFDQDFSCPTDLENHTIKGASKGEARGRSLPVTYLPLGDGTRWRAGWYKLDKPSRISLEPKRNRVIICVGRRNRSTPRSYEEIHGRRLISHSKVSRLAFPMESWPWERLSVKREGLVMSESSLVAVASNRTPMVGGLATLNCCHAIEESFYEAKATAVSHRGRRSMIKNRICVNPTSSVESRAGGLGVPSLSSGPLYRNNKKVIVNWRESTPAGHHPLDQIPAANVDPLRLSHVVLCAFHPGSAERSHATHSAEHAYALLSERGSIGWWGAREGIAIGKAGGGAQP